MKIIKNLLTGLAPACSGFSLWGLLLLVLFSAGLYVYLAAVQPHATHERVPIFFSNGLHFESNGLLYSCALYGLKQLGYTSDLALRSISIVSGLGTIVVVYLCGQMLGGPRTGLICAWVLAVNGTHIPLAAHNRFYAFNEFFCALATFLLLCAYTRERWRWWIAYALSVMFCIGSMVMSSALLLCHALILIFLPRKSRAWIAFSWVGFVGLAFFGWLIWRDPLAYQRFNYSEHFSLLWYIEFWFNNNYALAYQGAPPLWSHPYWQDPWALYAAFGLSLLAVVGLILKKQTERRTRIVMGLFMGWFFLALGLYEYSYQVKNILNNTNISWLLPILALIIGWALARYRLLLYVLALALLLNHPDSSGYYPSDYFSGIPYSFVARNLYDKDIVLLDPDCPGAYESSLVPCMDYVDNMPLRNVSGSLSRLPIEQSMRIVPCTKECMYRILRYVDTNPDLKMGRIWVVWANLPSSADNNSGDLDFSRPVLGLQQKYMLLYNQIVCEWEPQILLIAPAES